MKPKLSLFLGIMAKILESSGTYSKEELENLSKLSDDKWNELSKNGALILEVPKEIHGAIQRKFSCKEWKNLEIAPSTQKIGTEFVDGLAILEIENDKMDSTVEEFSLKSKRMGSVDSSKCVQDLFLNKQVISVEYADNIVYEEYHGLFSTVKSTLDDMVDGEMDGVTSAYYYIGYPRSFAGFHTEDSNLLSVNFMVDGGSKLWYIIPEEFSKEFEKFVKIRYPIELCRVFGNPEQDSRGKRKCDNVLSHKDFFVKPEMLRSAGIPVHEYHQKRGELIITAPGSYHAVVNGGYNVNIAVNFSNQHWHEEFQMQKVPCSCFRKKHSATELIDSQNAATRYGKEKDLSIRVKNSIDRNIKCSNCDYVSDGSNVKKHQSLAQKSRSKGLVYCKFCDFKSCSQALCTSHELGPHKDSKGWPNPIWKICEICRPVRYFKTKQSLFVHKRGKHDEAKKKTSLKCV